MSDSDRERKLAAVLQLSRTVRRTFRRLGQSANLLHADLGVTAAMRVVLEMVSEDGPMSVPQMARAKGLSRQHFQVKVDRLLAMELVRTEPNPAHARSPLIELTDRGRSIFAIMRAREDAMLLEAVIGIETADIEAAGRVLDGLTGRLCSHQAEEKSDE